MAGDARPLWRYAASEIVQGIAARAFSVREVLDSVLTRLDNVNPAVNAVVSVQADAARARADELDALAASGTLLPLHGVPVTTKINVDQQGLPTTNGTVFFKDRIAQADHPAVGNLRDAGAILIGRSNTPSFSMRWSTENEFHGRTHNPWARDRVAGGSSGGASAAVAVGIGPIAHGNDGGGSLRFPAFCCGVLGLRPSVGRVPSAPPPGMPDVAYAAQMISVQGPIARSAGDLRLTFTAMSKPNIRDPWWTPAPHDYPDNGTVRVAVSFDPTGSGVDPSTRRAIQKAADALAAAGYQVIEAEPPRFNDAVALWHALASQARNGMAPLIREHGDAGAKRLHELTVSRNTYDERRFVAALAQRTTLMRAWAEFHAAHPLLLCPVANDRPFRFGDDTRDQESVDAMYRSIAPLFPSSALGSPSLSVPVGVEEGLPIGVQLMAGRFREDLLLNAAAALEAHFGVATPVDPAKN